MARETVVEKEKKEWHSPEMKEICLLDTEGKGAHGSLEVTLANGWDCGPS